MTVKIAINGFGRIGRNIFRACRQAQDLHVVAINDLNPAPVLAHLLKYDSVRGAFPEPVSGSNGALEVAGREIPVFECQDPAQLPWRDLGVDLVLEATGKFTQREQAARHLAAGAARVIITAPGDNEDITLCLGVNQDRYDPVRHRVISNASCTTNCLAPVAKVLLEEFGLVKGMMTTVHAYTNGQHVLDYPAQDLRRARAAALSMIPTTTGAARAVAKVLPELEGRLDGLAVRVPTPNVSLISLVAELGRSVTIDEVNSAFRSAAEGRLKGILDYCEEPLVSVDFNGNPASSTIDALSTNVIGGNMVKVLSWYDNEWGYSNRVVDLVRFVAGRENQASW
ncbi:type I glyceraldehyde-3-phosphate dehydrogenase [Desulfuromonas sp. CSMB_57]|jgi:glyceraldehyde 3-phosphate dehydrogenase|uniref:type I glyceraldehyde-3-phosphate dehydrogenase n=1 Tax=Desulfuromonas sp. CSMB_57 TaxID=2807629 RepID=UPI001CD7F6FE|nr:type I glyceraldehyde-3-phosphate dehydrogenase [Desulfuromonas sp. CSMB_57]